MKLRHLLATALLTLPLLAHAAAPTPLPSADVVMSATKSQAAAEHKNILLSFSASWCGPCHLFEAFLRDPAIKPIMDKAFVIAFLDVGEHPTDPRHADSPGAVDLRTKLSGNKNPGFPYIVMLDPTGKNLADSMRPTKPNKPGDNIGYPQLPVEIDWFMTMLQKSAPNLTPQDTATIRTWLSTHNQ